MMQPSSELRVLQSYADATSSFIAHPTLDQALGTGRCGSKAEGWGGEAKVLTSHPDQRPVNLQG